MQSFHFTDDQRRRAVALVVALTANTPLQPLHYERKLLTRFEVGELTFEQFEHLVETSIYQVLYHSRAVGQPSAEELQFLLTQSRCYNCAHGITGLLLYSHGRFVQVLEGAETVVSDLYARIRQDDRHTQVETVRIGRAPQRFNTWSMRLGHVEEQELQELLRILKNQWPLYTPLVDEPQLLAAFS